MRITAESSRALDSLGGVGDLALVPAAQLVAEDSPSRSSAAADGTFRDYSSPLSVAVSDGRLLYDVAAFRNADFERRVVEGQGGTAFDPRREGFVDAPVQPHEMTTRADR